MIFKEKNGIIYLVSELLSLHPIPHAFMTRRGGVSSGDFSSLNVSTRRKDSEGRCDLYENTVENFSRLLSIVGATPEDSVCAHQVHGNRILELCKDHAGMGILRTAKINEDADGLYLRGSGDSISAICVKSADCTPVLLADKRTGAVCALHSGWRGTAMNIVGNAVDFMIARGSKKQDLLCAVGPCIGECCYEVSGDVFDATCEMMKAIGAEHLADSIFTNRTCTPEGTKYHYNIGKMCVTQAITAGVEEQNTDLADLCTCCFKDEDGRVFFSHRGQNGFSGTFASIIAPI